MKKSDDIEFHVMWDLFPPNIQHALRDAVKADQTKAGFIRYTSTRLCPHCGKRNTTDCQKITGIKDGSIGLCLSCGYIWCLECDAQLVANIRCGHWEVCAYCNEKTKSFGDCSAATWECKHVKLWLTSNYPTV